MKVSRTLRNVIGLLGAAFAAYLWAPRLVFDDSKVAYDMNCEYRDGKVAAWGPRPAKWLLLGDARQTTFSGEEWCFVLFESYCDRWLKRHDYVVPLWPPHRSRGR